LLLIAVTWVGNREQKLADMNEQVAQLRVRAMEVDAMRTQLQKRTEMETTLGLQNARKQTSVELLNELTSCISADTWLDQLDVRADGTVIVSGLSRKASALTSELMRCVSLDRAEFQGGIQPEHNSDMERFNIQAYRRVPGA
jgi:general secretion pathway protein L